MNRQNLFLAIVLLFAQSMFAQIKFVHAQGKQLVDPEGKPLLLKGTNLGNWLVQEGYMFRLEKGPQSASEIEQFSRQLLGPAEAKKFWKEFRERYITRDDIQWIAKSGYNSIRIPFHYKFFTEDTDEGFMYVDRVVRWAKEAGLFVVLDMHAAPGGQTGANIDDSDGYPWLFESEDSQREIVSIWARIAAHYKDEPNILGYDLMNEPIPHYPEVTKLNDRLEPLLKRITAEIRKVDQNHVIVLEAAQWDTNFKVFGPPFDKNLLYQFHRYWMPPTQDKIADVVEFRDKYNVPIWLGESGENEDKWIEEFRTLLEKNNIGWAFWPYKKMDNTRGPVQFKRPQHWDEIVAFGQTDRSLGNIERSLKARPPNEHSKIAFRELLDNIQFKNCAVNEGYMKALGLKPADVGR
jgi:endoglucanase